MRFKEEPKKPEFKKRESALMALLISLSKALPAGLVAMMGGPMVAGALLLALGGLALGGGTLYLGLMASGLKTPNIKKNYSTFGKFLGDQKSMAETVLDPDAIRAASADNEEPHPDDETSLGYLIPEDMPGSDKDKDGKEKKDADYKKADGSKMDAEAARALKSRFGGDGEGGGGSLSGGNFIPMGGAGGSGIGAGAGRQLLGSGAGAGSSAGGATARNRKAAIRSTDGRFRTKRGAKASEALRNAGKIVSQAPRMDQLAAGYTGAGFGEIPKSASVLPGGPGGTAQGTIAPSGGSPTQPQMKGSLPSGQVTPDRKKEDEDATGGKGKFDDFSYGNVPWGAYIPALLMMLGAFIAWQKKVRYMEGLKKLILTLVLLAVFGFAIKKIIGEIKKDTCKKPEGCTAASPVAACESSCLAMNQEVFSDRNIGFPRKIIFMPLAIGFYSSELRAESSPPSCPPAPANCISKLGKTIGIILLGVGLALLMAALKGYGEAEAKQKAEKAEADLAKEKALEGIRQANEGINKAKASNFGPTSPQSGPPSAPPAQGSPYEDKLRTDPNYEGTEFNPSGNSGPDGAGNTYRTNLPSHRSGGT
ncbi:MAG: hypothetical protein HY401_05220 [Elusimicrobia bacterium]|nr:hypothetical protein [Elusimicrobiota bacterium]